MNQVMDQRLKALEKPKSKPVTLSEEDREEVSRLVMRPGSRKLQTDEVRKAVGGRLFCPLDALNSAGGIYTVGVVVERSGVLSSKSGKRFMSFKVSDLEKYDMQKVR